MENKFKFQNVPVDKITTGYFQVAIKVGAKIEELEAESKLKACSNQSVLQNLE